jgi:hypothetical protein
MQEIVIYPKPVLEWVEQVKKNLNNNPGLKQKLIYEPGIPMGTLLEALAVASYNKFIIQKVVELLPEEIVVEGRTLEREKKIIELVKSEQLIVVAVTDQNEVLFGKNEDRKYS